MAMTQNTEHAASYYAATVQQKTAYPSLQGEHTADVVVVGAIVVVTGHMHSPP